MEANGIRIGSLGRPAGSVCPATSAVALMGGRVRSWRQAPGRAWPQRWWHLRLHASPTWGPRRLAQVSNGTVARVACVRRSATEIIARNEEREMVSEEAEPRSVLILTGTLRPSSDVYALKRASWDIRERDYLASAKRWADARYNIWNEMWLVDNSPEMSASDWATFEGKLIDCSSARIKPVRLVDATGRESCIQKGKGEALLMDAVIQQLVARKVTYFSKVTGRLFVSNADQILQGKPFNGISASISTRLDMSDTRFLGMPVQTWIDHFKDMAPEVDETKGRLFEHVFARRALMAVAAGVPFHGTRRIPRFVGASGSMNIDYGSRRTRLNQALHELARTPYRRRSIGLTL